MTVTALDPNTALVIVDLQKGIVSYPTAHPATDVVQNARRLAQAFRTHALPVVLVNVVGGAPGRVEQARSSVERPPDWAELVPELDLQTRDHRISKKTWGAFTQTGLEQYLRERGVTQIVLAGISTSIGVESTARQAHELGFHVALATAALAGVHPDARRKSGTRIVSILVDAGSTQEILNRLDQTRPHP